MTNMFRQFGKFLATLMLCIGLAGFVQAAEVNKGAGYAEKSASNTPTAAPRGLETITVSKPIAGDSYKSGDLFQVAWTPSAAVTGHNRYVVLFRNQLAPGYYFLRDVDVYATTVTSSSLLVTDQFITALVNYFGPYSNGSSVADLLKNFTIQIRAEKTVGSVVGDRTTQVLDTVGLGDSGVFTFTQATSPATLTLSATGASSATVGQVYNLSVSSTSTNTTATTALSVDWGDSSSASTGTVVNNAASFTHSFTAAGNRTVTVTATLAGITKTATVSVAVSDVQATTVVITGSPATTVVLGNVYSAEFAVTVSPTSATLPTVLVTGTDNVYVTPNQNANGKYSFSHTYSAAGTYTYTVGATLGSVVAAPVNVTVTVTDPTPTTLVTISGVSGSTVVLGAVYTATFTVSITPATATLPTVTATGTDGVLAETLVRQTNGTYVFTHTYGTLGAHHFVVNASLGGVTASPVRVDLTVVSGGSTFYQYLIPVFNNQDQIVKYTVTSDFPGVYYYWQDKYGVVYRTYHVPPGKKARVSLRYAKAADVLK